MTTPPTRAVKLIYLLLLLASCDPDGKKQCEWVLEPDENRSELVTDQAVPACARNFKSSKQDCRLLVPRELAKEWEGRKFRYEDLKVKGAGIPRKVVSITPCR